MSEWLTGAVLAGIALYVFYLVEDTHRRMRRIDSAIERIEERMDYHGLTMPEDDD